MTEQAAPHNLNPEHLLTLYEITRTMNSSLDFNEVLNHVMDSMMDVTKAQRGFLMLADDETGELRVLIQKGEGLEEEGYSTTIVNQVVATREPLLTNNAQFDTRFQAGQSIIMRGLRAILSAPMLVKDRLVGVVYVDTSMRSRNFSQSDRDLLNAVAGQAAIALDNARLYTVAVEKGRIERELQMASEIQQGLLPHRMPNTQGYQMAAAWRPAREVAGDFYDAFALGDDRAGVVIADVSDKGAPAALFMAVARTMIRSHANLGLPPVDVVARTNDLILEDAESGMFVTVYHSQFFSDGRSLHVNAGHNPPLLYRHGTGELDYLPRGGRAVGWFPDNPLQELEFRMSAGDVIVYYTDGLTEAENPDGDYYGEARLAQIVAHAGARSAQEILEAILDDVEVFCNGASPFDDLTILVVRYLG
ncbi:MAG: GAF domain-containing SpoIIE family protein phosphatase [bacterium]|nr:GAF domain-containing SpoIIE family protein phosphatase [bacterium]